MGNREDPVITVLVFLGIGYSLKHLTLEAIEYLGKADKIVIDRYTSLYEDDPAELAKYTKGEVVYASRKDLEGEGMSKLIEEARFKTIVLAVPGDPFIATTHDSLRVEAIKKGVEVKVVNSISVLTLIQSRLGLQAYRFGKTVTLVYPDYFKPYSTIETIYENLNRRLHTIVLLDLRLEHGRAMTIHEAVEILLKLDDELENKLDNSLAIGVARLSWRDERVQADLLPRLVKYDFPPPPHSLVIVSTPLPVEMEGLKLICKLPE
ncbi:diphthine synthase [Thermosphaera chiliense]|uniref:diphthine synthase n=1 Tax=Thermosphaera chiliense TaxID=3402707 RepID=UPI0029CA3F20|nr:diphthine synthase [Thermosphaera aggregans]